MRIPKPLLFILAAFVTIGALRPTQAHAQVSISFFYDNLSPYGEWVDDPDYGYCWHPTSVDQNWSPYTDGYWAYTDDGWTWVSYEDFGGIVYHYGRWAQLQDEGWVWVPGYQWAPAWVSWRSNDDYVGWAPLPPEAHWRANLGFGSWVDAHFDIGPGNYSFVRCGDFGAPALAAVIVGREQNVTIINRTTNITNITVNNTNVYTGGPNYRTLAARSTRPIPRLKLVRQTGAGAIANANGKILSRQQGNQLTVIAPRVTAPTGKAPAPGKVARTLTGVKADHGWGAVKDPQQRAQLQSQYKSQAGTALTPAHAVKPDDLKVVNEKVTATPPPNAAVTNEVTPGVAGTPKGKGKKPKTPTDAELLNTPATEVPGATPAPKPPKGKGRKTPPAVDQNAFETPGTQVPATDVPATEVPKTKKGKKPSPATFDQGNPNTGAPATFDEPKPQKIRKPSPATFDQGAPSGGAPASFDEPKPKKVRKANPPAEFQQANPPASQAFEPPAEKPKHVKQTNDSPNLQPFNGGGPPPGGGNSFSQGKGGPQPSGKGEEKKKKGKGEPTPQQ